MDFLHIPKQEDIRLKTAGQLLVAEPFLSDPNFSRATVLLCDHSEKGTIGFVINRITDFNLEDLLPEIAVPAIPIYTGGPVQADTMHMLHRIPHLLGGQEVCPGIYWGGAFEALKDALINNTCNTDDVKLLLGYSGWSEGQLDTEMKQGSWYVAEPSISLLFETDTAQIWQDAIRSLGTDYTHLVNLPVNPQLN